MYLNAILKEKKYLFIYLLIPNNISIKEELLKIRIKNLYCYQVVVMCSEYI